MFNLDLLIIPFVAFQVPKSYIKGWKTSRATSFKGIVRHDSLSFSSTYMHKFCSILLVLEPQLQ